MTFLSRSVYSPAAYSESGCFAAERRLIEKIFTLRLENSLADLIYASASGVPMEVWCIVLG